MRRVLVAIGGNALFDAEGGNNIDPNHLDAVCRQLVGMIQQGCQPIVTFGNGPQVGNLLEMAENYNAPPKWPIPLDVCVAWTQAEMGYMLTKALYNQLRTIQIDMPIVEINTTVQVDRDDPAFLNATKFVGNFYPKEDAEKVSEERGWEMKADSNRGYRRVVASPKPIRVLEVDAIRQLVETGCLVLCGGGGGIPVAEEDGVLRGIEAVIDKDYTACLLASTLHIPELVICTGVDYVYLNYGTADQKALETVTISEAQGYLDDGQFPPGSMGPKVEALIRFLQQGGQRAVMTRLESLQGALAGQIGTHFVPDPRKS